MDSAKFRTVSAAGALLAAELALVPPTDHVAHGVVLIGGAGERLYLRSGDVEPLAHRALGIRELTQAGRSVESAESGVTDSAERHRRHADEGQHRVHRDAAGAQLAGDLVATTGGEHR